MKSPLLLAKGKGKLAKQHFSITKFMKIVIYLLLLEIAHVANE